MLKKEKEEEKISLTLFLEFIDFLLDIGNCFLLIRPLVLKFGLCPNFFPKFSPFVLEGNLIDKQAFVLRSCPTNQSLVIIITYDNNNFLEMNNQQQYKTRKIFFYLQLMLFL